MTIRALGIALLLLITSAPRAYCEWAILKWMERPVSDNLRAWVTAEDRIEFLQTLSFNPRHQNEESWQVVRQTLREGDVIAYHEGFWQTLMKIFLLGNVNKMPYGLFKYGHLAMVVKDGNHEDSLRLLSSWAFRGPNIEENLDSLRNHSWHLYRLNHWERVNKNHFYEFIRLVRERAEKWYGYDFSGMLGLWNSNLQPRKPDDVAEEYTCSTVILAALYYAGVELDVSPRHGIADIVTPLQVINSKGSIIAVRTTDDVLSGSPGLTVASGHEVADIADGENSGDEG